VTHKEMSRRVLAIGLVWGFWLFWVIAGIAFLTTHEIARHRVLLGYDGRYPKPEYTSTGLIVAICVWLIASVFPMVLEQWKYRNVGRRCAYEFTLTALAVILVVCVSLPGSQKDGIYLGCFLVMVGLSYSCFRLRQVGLDYLEPLQGADEPDSEKRDDAKEN
jgi:hypothetical protein